MLRSDKEYQFFLLSSSLSCQLAQILASDPWQKSFRSFSNDLCFLFFDHWKEASAVTRALSALSVGAILNYWAALPRSVSHNFAKWVGDGSHMLVLLLLASPCGLCWELLEDMAAVHLFMASGKWQVVSENDLYSHQATEATRDRKREKVTDAIKIISSTKRGLYEWML